MEELTCRCVVCLVQGRMLVLLTVVRLFLVPSSYLQLQSGWWPPGAEE